VTLGTLWRRYSAECRAFLDNKPDTRKDAATRAAILIGHFGEQCDVRTLTADEQAVFVEARRTGGIGYGAEGAITGPARARSAESDLNLLHAVLRWATTVRKPDGRRWLDANPLGGIPRPREANPCRPVATWERFNRTRTRMQYLSMTAASEVERARWLKMELALVLAEGTGRRLSSIRQLRWEDIDFRDGSIRWRAEFDKKGKEWLIPYPPEFMASLRTFQEVLGAAEGRMFAGERFSSQPMDRHLFDKWLAHVERQEGLRKLKGGLWHPYRRKWATERKDWPVTDVAAAGGWTDTDTLLKCYQQPERATLLRVTGETKKVTERGVER
jgi:integrase